MHRQRSRFNPTLHHRAVLKIRFLQVPHILLIRRKSFKIILDIFYAVASGKEKCSGEDGENGSDHTIHYCLIVSNQGINFRSIGMKALP